MCVGASAFSPMCANVHHFCQLPSVFDPLQATILRKEAEVTQPSTRMHHFHPGKPVSGAVLIVHSSPWGWEGTLFPLSVQSIALGLPSALPPSPGECRSEFLQDWSLPCSPAGQTHLLQSCNNVTLLIETQFYDSYHMSA